MDEITEARMKRVRQVTGIAALVAAGAMLFGLALNFLVIEPLVGAIGAEGFDLGFTASYWLTLAAGLVALVGLVVGWRLVQPRWSKGLGLVGLGFVLDVGWSQIKRHFDVWQLGKLGDAGGDLDPRFVQVAQLAFDVDILVTVVAITLLIFGGLKVLRSPLLTPAPEPTEE